MDGTIRVAIAEDHTLVRDSLKMQIEALSGISFLFAAKNGKELIQNIQRSQNLPHVCILDINMPQLDGFDTLNELKNKWPEIGVLMLTGYEHEMFIVRTILDGASGYLEKTCDFSTVATAIRSIHSTGMFFSDTISMKFLASVKNRRISLPVFTVSELEVLKHCCSDMSYGEIAAKMGCTQKSVEGHKDSLFRKLEVNNRVGLVLFAIQYGIVQLDSHKINSSKFFRK